MKKILILMISIACIAALTACSNKKTDGNDLTSALLTSDKLIIGTSPDYPPFESLDASGNLQGFEIDMIQEVITILNEQNDTNLTAEFKVLDFNNIIGALQASQIDIGVSGFTYNPERDCIFSTPHLLSKQVIITRADTGITKAEDLSGKKVGAGPGTTGAEAVSKIEGAELVHPGDYTIMFQALQAGQLDAVVCDEGVGDNYVREMGLVKCEEALVNEDMSVIIKTGNTVLEEKFNAAVETFMESEAYQALLDKWGL